MALVVTTDFFHDRSVLVTGATGFVGRALVAALQPQGARVRVLIRSSQALAKVGVESVVGDLTDSASLRRACTGINTVIHAAGFAHASSAATPEQSTRHWTINAEGTFQLLDAAVAAGVERFVFLSSVKVAGPPGPHCVDEAWNSPSDTPYGQAKRAAEARVLQVGRDFGLHTVNLRLALVYGPAMQANLARFVRAVQRGWCPPLPDTGNRRSLVHVVDVAQAALLAVAHPVAKGQTYLVTDGCPYSGRELYLTLCQALKKPAPHWVFPAAILYGTAALADKGLGLIGRQGKPVHAALDKVLGWACYDSSRITRELGYQPEWTFQRFCAEQWKRP